jgi:hypothetical protein
VLLIAGDLGPYAAATVLRSNLARIGIAVRIVHDSGSDPRTVPAAFRKADMIIGTSVTCGPCERDPLPSFQSVLERSIWGTPLPAGPWSRPAFRRQLQRAALLRGQPRIEAYTRLEDEFARYAPVAVYGSFQYSEYFGVRVGCKRFQPFTQGVDLGSLCVTKT